MRITEDLCLFHAVKFFVFVVFFLHSTLRGPVSAVVCLILGDIGSNRHLYIAVYIHIHQSHRCVDELRVHFSSADLWRSSFLGNCLP